MKKAFLTGCLLMAALAPISAAFVDDEFDGPTLGPQWTFNPGTPAAGLPDVASYSFEDGKLVLHPARGADTSWEVDNGAYVEQDMPTDPEWEVEACLYDFNPAVNAYRWTKASLVLHQDNNNWIMLSFTSTDNGTQINWYGQAQMEPDPLPGNKERYRNEFRGENVGSNENVFLRIRKTVDGYFGEYSWDKIEWVPMTPPLRNPASPDGTLNGKIRLMLSAPAPNAAMGTRLPNSARWDYVRKTTLSTPVVPFANDEFDGTSTANWSFYGGNPAGTISIVDGQLAMTAKRHSTSPGGSDIGNKETGSYNETGVIASQNAPADSDWTVYTKVDPLTFLNASPYRSHGIRVWQDQNTWAGLKTLKNNAAPGATATRNSLEALFENDNNTTRAAQTINSPDAATSAPGYLRIDKRADTVRLMYSTDGIVWTAAMTSMYTDGYIPMTFMPGKPLKIHLFAAKPPVGAAGTEFFSTFEFIRALPVANVSDWQLY